MRMFFNPLHNFISPVTGRVPIQKDYILLGDNNGFSLASPIIIDMRLDMIDLRRDFNDLSTSSFIIGFPNNNLPNAQVLNSLSDGFMFNTAGIVSTTNNVPLPSLTYNNIWIGDVNNSPVANPIILQSNLPNLTQNNMWIGDSNNRPQITKIISIDNLPNLGTASISVPNPLDPTTPITISGGKIWHGTDSNRPEESTALLIVEGDVALINFRFFSANFIMGSGNVVLKTLMPFSQFLDGLAPGLLKQDVPGKILRAVPGTDYVDVSSVDFDEGFVSLLPVNNDKLIRKSTIRVVDNQDIDRIRTLRAESINADQNVQAVHNIIGNESLGSRELRFYDYATPYVNYVTFKGPASVLGTPAVTWTVPSAAGTDGQVLTTDSNNVLSFKNILPDGLNNTLLAQGQVGGKSTFINATLTNGKFWKGDANNRPIESDINFAPNDASYILKTANANLNQAQALDILGIGMAKIVAGGAFAIAIADEDYATKATLEQIKAETEAFKNEAATSAEEAAASATEAAASATEASASAVEATGAAATATTAAGAAGASATAAGLSATGAGISALAAAGSAISAGSSSSSASSSASDASSSAINAAGSSNSAASSATQAHDYLNTLLTTGITLQGDIIGSGGLSSPITTTFTPNPTFTGKEYIRIPTGTIAERPSISEKGMLRYNIEI